MSPTARAWTKSGAPSSAAWRAVSASARAKYESIDSTVATSITTPCNGRRASRSSTSRCSRLIAPSVGLGGIGAALLGMLADDTSLRFVYQVCAFLPAIGLLGGFLPEPRPADA